ncbi:MAG: glycosyltransferase [Spirochaetales bacterium]|nr:glycosyltransferase [Spirochaetales bacterium]
MKTEKISIVIPTFNRKNDICEVLDSLQQQNYENYEIIVIDDCSTDGSKNYIQIKYPGIICLSTPINSGPAIARNIGLEKASGSIIVGIDSDVIISDKELLNKTISCFEKHPEADCLSFRILNYYDKKDDEGRWWHPHTIETHFNKYFYSNYFSGTGYAVKRSLIETVGYFPDYVFMDNEEVDYSLRIINSNLNILYTPEIFVLHKISRKARMSDIPFFFKRRNQIWMVIRYYPIIKGISYLIPRIIKTFLLSLRKKKLKLYFKGLLQAIKETPKHIAVRKPFNKKFWKRIAAINQEKFNPGDEKYYVQ